MRVPVLALAAIGFVGCSTSPREASAWPATFPFYVTNQAGESISVLWTFGNQEKRSEILPGEEAKLLPPFITDAEQPENRILAIESTSAHFDLSYLQQSRMPELWFVVKDPTTIAVYLRSARDFEQTEHPIIILKGNVPNQPPLRMPVSGTPAAGAPVAPPPGIAGR